MIFKCNTCISYYRIELRKYLFLKIKKIQRSFIGITMVLLNALNSTEFHVTPLNSVH